MLQIRRVSEADKRDLWVWRNDPVTISASLSPAAVTWARHSQWFERILADRDSALYVGELDSGADKVGMCRFDLREGGDSAEVSINLNPEHRGKRLSRPLLAAAIDQFHSDITTVTQLTALIRESNEASRKLFTSVGFTQVSQTAGVGTFILPLAD